MVVCVAVCGTAVIVLVIVRVYRNSVHTSDTGKCHISSRNPYIFAVKGFWVDYTVFSLLVSTQARNVEYDEVVLPPTSSSTSSVIPTEPNTAYVSTTMSHTIPTEQNVAYGVHSSNT